MLLPETRPPGISFVVRARNEAAVLGHNLRSLQFLSVPHEIVLVLHCCTDDSKAIAQERLAAGQPIRLVEDNTLISRAGYETLVTPADHFRSLPSFYNRVFGRARYNWVIKWDADFVATEYFLQFLNTEVDLALTAPTAYRLYCALGQDEVSREEYMFNTCLGYTKHVYWEEIQQVSPRNSVVMHTPCMLSYSPRHIKPYWREVPWFLQPETRHDTIAAKHHKLVEIVGPEPVGLARAFNPEFTEHWRRLMAARGELAKYGIDPLL